MLPAASPRARASRGSPSTECRHAGAKCSARAAGRTGSDEHLVNSGPVRLSLVPRPTEFYDLFARAGANALEAARQAETRFREYPNSSVTQADVKAIETAGDQITRELITLAEHAVRNAVRPRGHLRARDQARRRRRLHRGGQRPARAVRDRVHDEACSRAVPDPRPGGRAALDRPDALKGLRGIQQPLVELKRLEDEGDRIVHDAIAALFRDDRIDPLIVIRWKDVYEGLERAIDSCETAANVIANIAVKNAVDGRSDARCGGRRRALLRLHERIPRHRELDRHERLDPAPFRHARL